MPLAYGPARAPAPVRPWRLSVALEGALMPGIDSATATPTTCRPGKGPDRTDFLFALVRPRVSLSLPAGFNASAGWIPPIRINGLKANIISLALGRVTRVGGQFRLGTRLHATLGELHAPITCDDDALLDPQSECFGGQRSNDRFQPNIFGIDATLGWPVAAGRFQPYIGAGYSHLSPRFRVNFTNIAGQTDRRRVEVDLDRGAVFGGITWMAGNTADVTAEVYSVPADATTVRLLLRYSPGTG
ncbi:MAG: hypothetical protein ACREL6_03545, partial [Gemmatimonadales bacterium]